MANAVSDARARHGVRVFNMSLNILQPAAPDRYSPHAARLDRIAESNNAVVFISAGNIQPQDLRAERSEEHTSELQSLMRTSYAVFCWKEKICTTVTNAHNQCSHLLEKRK